jgi:hypothetical protein
MNIKIVKCRMVKLIEKGKTNMVDTDVAMN